MAGNWRKIISALKNKHEQTVTMTLTAPKFPPYGCCRQTPIAQLATPSRFTSVSMMTRSSKTSFEMLLVLFIFVLQFFCQLQQIFLPALRKGVHNYLRSSVSTSSFHRPPHSPLRCGLAGGCRLYSIFSMRVYIDIYIYVCVYMWVPPCGVAGELGGLTVDAAYEQSMATLFVLVVHNIRININHIYTHKYKLKYISMDIHMYIHIYVNIYAYIVQLVT